MSKPSQTLFEWPRASKNSKPKLDVRNESDVSGWLSKLEKRVDIESPSNRQRVSPSTQNDAAYFEAKQLLRDWSMKRDAIVEELLNEERGSVSRNDIRKAWDSFEEQIASNNAATNAFDVDLDHDFYSKLLEMDTSEARKQISSELLKKDIIKPQELERMKQGGGDNERADKFSALRAKMDMRHAKVREMRLQREAERSKRLEERKLSQEVREQARDLVVAEERAKVERERREEQLIAAEMQKIRSQLQQQARLSTAKQQVKVQPKAKVQRTQSPEQQQVVELDSATRSSRLHEKIAEVEAKQRNAEVRLVRRCFAAWFNETLESRLQFAKLSAIADFKLKRRCFCGWRNTVRSQRIERELAETRRETQQTAAAERHFALQTLRKCFFALRRHANQCISERLAAELETERRRRVDNFLQHLALQQTASPYDDAAINTKVDSTRSNSDFADAQNQATASSSSLKEQPKAKVGQPRTMEPWRVTKAILKTDLTNLERSESRDNALQRNVVQSLETRQRSYQLVLAEQTRLIKEQKRMIEELRSEQRSANLQAQLAREKLEADLVNKFSQLASTVRPAVAVDSRVLTTKESRFALTKPGQQPSSNPDTSRMEEARRTSTVIATTTIASQHQQKPSEGNDKEKNAADFHSRMQQRAAERQRQKAEREQRRRLAEEERLLAQQQEAMARERAEQEEKTRRVTEARERARLAREQQEARVQSLAHVAELNRRAEQHRLHSLLKGSFLRWRRYVHVTVPNRLEIFHTYFRHRVLRRALLAWHASTQNESLAKKQLADELHGSIVVRRCFRAWKLSLSCADSDMQTAEMHHAMHLCRVAFHAWTSHTLHEQNRQYRNERVADEHFEKKLLQRTLDCWKRVPEIEKEERSREARLAELRKKVLEVLPDFSKR